MLKKVQISNIHSEVTDRVKSYTHKKIGKLEKYIPKAARESVAVDVKFKKKNSKDSAYECEVVMSLPKSKITAHRSGDSFQAAVDEVAENLKKQLKKYKETHDTSRRVRHVFAKIRLRSSRFSSDTIES